MAHVDIQVIVIELTAMTEVPRLIEGEDDTRIEQQVRSFREGLNEKMMPRAWWFQWSTMWTASSPLKLHKRLRSRFERIKAWWAEWEKWLTSLSCAGTLISPVMSQMRLSRSSESHAAGVGLLRQIATAAAPSVNMMGMTRVAIFRTWSL